MYIKGFLIIVFALGFGGSESGLNEDLSAMSFLDDQKGF